MPLQSVTSQEEFIAALRSLKVQAGNPSLRDLQQLSGIPRSTLADALKPDRFGLPRLDVVTALVQALGADAETTARWQRTWKTLQVEEDHRRTQHAPEGSEGPAWSAQDDAPWSAPGSGSRNFLPGDLADFTGRAAETDRLLNQLGRLASQVVAISAIDGMAGIGKTTLAVHAAHLLAPKYPDGQFYVNLHGHTPGHEPLGAARALQRLLGLIGVAENRIPTELEDRSALWRAELAGRSVLLILDNAADAEQIRPLLPGDGGCLTLVTSRRRLVDLYEATPMSMDVMPSQDAVMLFNRVAGRDGTGAVASPGTSRPLTQPPDQDPDCDAVAEAVRLCGYLPLAIRIAAARLRHRPSWTVADLIGRLREQAGRTPTGLGQGQVAVAFELSYRRLEPEQQRVFRLLGLHPGVDFDAEAVAALTQLPVPRAESLLEDLLDHHLIQQHSPWRYTLHDLLRGYSRQLVHDALDESELRAPLIRLFDHYQFVAAAAMDVLYPLEYDLRPHPPRPETECAVPTEAASAKAWLDTHTANLVACATLAATKSPDHASGLTLILRRYIDNQASYVEAVAMHTAAVEAARTQGDAAGQTQALLHLASILWRLGRYPTAMDRYREAIAAAAISGDQSNDSRTQDEIGIAHLRLGDYQGAIRHCLSALTRARTDGDRVGESHFLISLGFAHLRLGERQQAYEELNQALVILRQTGDQPGEARALSYLAVLFGKVRHYSKAEAIAHTERTLALAVELGDYGTQASALSTLGVLYAMVRRFPEAQAHLDQAFTLARNVDHRPGEAMISYDQGLVYMLMGRYDAAADRHRHALALARETGLGEIERDALNGLGEAARADRRPGSAIGHFREAIALAARLEDRHELARSLLGLGDAHDDLGQCGPARESWRQALAIFRDLDSPESDEVLRRLEADRGQQFDQQIGDGRRLDPNAVASSAPAPAAPAGAELTSLV